LQRLGLSDESVRAVAWEDLDRVVEPDHLTSLWIPALAAPVASELATLASVVRRLREECPWDREQTHASLTRYVLEEAYEVVDAIEGGSVDHLEEELGDLLLQVFLHSAIAEQAGDFTLADVARGITEKMVRRHPHVFAGLTVEGVDDVRRNWEQIKAEEKGRPPGASVLDGVAGSLPALTYAAKLSKRAATVGFEWPALGDVYAKVDEELAELKAEPSADELGDVLFTVVNVARHLGLDPEASLRGATNKFRRRFSLVEAAAAARGIDLASAGPEVVDSLWREAKAT
jgi:MazG family protein